MKKTQEITDKKLLFDYHTAFYKLFHIPLDWSGENQRNLTICGKEHCNPLCVRIMEHEAGAALCRKVSREAIETGKKTRLPVIKKCHAGFYDVLIPIFVDSQYVGSLCIGQYIQKMPDAESVQNVLKELSFLNLTTDELKKYYRQTKKFTREESEGLIELVRQLAEYICDSYGRISFFKSVNRTDAIQAAEQYIQNHYASNLTVTNIARAVGLSKSYLLHKFSEQTGVPPIIYLNRYRVEKAVELLENSSLNISEIAYICGFNNIVTFNRNFVKIHNVSPSKYRMQHRNSATAGKE